ncbi:MAG: aminoacyl-tRNA deacylase [Candidatus Promineifilaceae bacterium]|jgi:Cys-tRNA(Pro)/Cys-tRNA(Cys) deacylase
MAQKKTLAMKLLDGKKISYNAYSYPDNLRDAEEVAQALDLPFERVFKTLVISRPKPDKNILAMVPANRQLDLKKLAKSVGDKKLKMASHRDAEALTGLQVGGISALALLNRGFDVYLDQSAAGFEQIIVSAGERGQQIELAVGDLVKLTRARYVDLSQ